MVSAEGVTDFFRAVSFPDRGFDTMRKQAGCEGVHARTGCRTGGADDPSGRGRSGTNIINHLTGKIERKGEIFVKQFEKTQMSHITSGVHGTTKQGSITGMELFDIAVQKRG
jgi:hypothetical protein